LALNGFVFWSAIRLQLSVTSCGIIAYSDFVGFENGFVCHFFGAKRLRQGAKCVPNDANVRRNPPQGAGKGKAAGKAQEKGLAPKMSQNQHSCICLKEFSKISDFVIKKQLRSGQLA